MTERHGDTHRINIISLVVLVVNINMTPLENDVLWSAKFVEVIPKRLYFSDSLHGGIRQGECR